MNKEDINQLAKEAGVFFSEGKVVGHSYECCDSSSKLVYLDAADLRLFAALLELKRLDHDRIP